MTAALLSLLVLAPQTTVELTGETIASARIEGGGKIGQDLARYVELVPGEPLRVEAVRHVVELLHATGRIEDVLVDAERSPQGVHLVFRPVLAPLLLKVTVLGDPLLKPGEIKVLARLREGEPLWSERLDRASSDVTAALVERGYLEARVDAAVRGEGPAAEAVFTLHGGPRIRVRGAAIEGPPTALRGALARIIRPSAGQVMKGREAEEAAEKMRAWLVKRGYWRAAVEVERSYQPGSASLDLVFRVSQGPRLRMEFRGSPQPDKGLAKTVSNLIREGRARTDVLEEAAERLEEALRLRGHRDAVVAQEEEARADASVLVYTIEAGPQAHVGSVRVATEAVEGLDALVSVRPGQPLVDSAIDRDVRELSRALEERGHAQAKVEAEVAEGGGSLAVVFRVREGPLVTLAAVSVDSPVPTPVEAAPQEMRLRVGRPYRLRDLAADRSTLIAAFRDGGYPQVEVTPEVLLSADRTQATIVLHVVPGTRMLVDHIVIAGLRRTREEVVRRELQVEEAQPLGLQKVLESQRRLSALGVFRRTSLTEMDPESEERRSLVVSVEEAPVTTVAYGVGYAERDRLRGSVEVSRRNLFGMDRSVSTFARISFKGSRLLASYREPYVLGRKQELFVTAFREEEDRPFFDFVRFGGFVQTGFRLAAPLNLIVRYTYQKTDTFNIEDPSQVGREFTASKLSGPSLSLINDTRDDPLDPHRGRFLSADIVLSHAVIGGNSFVKGFLQASSYHRLTARNVLALSARLGLARTFGLDEPLFLPRADRFYAGGDYSLRGFPLDAVNLRGGNGLILAGAELRAEAARSFSTAIFGEAGNVYPLVSEMSLRDLRYTAGIGLRYRSAFGPLRLDWGHKLNRRPGESASHFHFTVGHAF